MILLSFIVFILVVIDVSHIYKGGKKKCLIRFSHIQRWQEEMSDTFLTHTKVARSNV